MSESHAPSPSFEASNPATFARYLDVLEAEHNQSVIDLSSAADVLGKAYQRADEGDHGDFNVTFEDHERAEHLRNVTWTMLVQASALLGVSR